MDEQRNYTGSAFWITLIVVVMTVGMSLIPGFQVGRASVKRVNILSDLIRQEEHPRLEEADLYFDTTFLAEGRAIEAAAAADSLAADSAGGRQAAEPEIRELVWDLPGYRPMPGHDRSGNEGTGIDSAALVAIEDFGGEVPAMEHFYRTMLEKDRRRPVRIAVLGDSFIEGDIVTADVRERMQDLYGGCGVGCGLVFGDLLGEFLGCGDQLGLFVGGGGGDLLADLLLLRAGSFEFLQRGTANLVGAQHLVDQFDRFATLTLGFLDNVSMFTNELNIKHASQPSAESRH